jgi:hypothetical protein
MPRRFISIIHVVTDADVLLKRSRSQKQLVETRVQDAIIPDIEKHPEIVTAYHVATFDERDEHAPVIPGNTKEK